MSDFIPAAEREEMRNWCIPSDPCIMPPEKDRQIIALLRHADACDERIARLEEDCEAYAATSNKADRENAALRKELAEAKAEVERWWKVANYGGPVGSDLTHADEVICDLEEIYQEAFGDHEMIGYYRVINKQNAEIDKLRTLLTEAGEVLKSLEWEGNTLDYEFYGNECPECEAEASPMQGKAKHTDNCRLAALLAKIEEVG